VDKKTLNSAHDIGHLSIFFLSGLCPERVSRPSPRDDFVENLRAVNGWTDVMTVEVELELDKRLDIQS
jgi:hypothetical protein